MNKEKYHVIRTRKASLSPAYWNVEARTSPMIKKIHGASIQKFWIAYHAQGKYRAFFLKREFDYVSSFFAQNLYNKKSYIPAIKRKERSCAKRISQLLQKLSNSFLEKKSFRELVHDALEIQRCWIEYDVITTPVWGIGGDAFFGKVFQELAIPLQDFQMLATPLARTYISELEYQLTRHAYQVFVKKRNLNRSALYFEKTFGWIPFGYDGPVYWDAHYFRKKLTKLTQGSQKRLKKKWIELQAQEKSHRATRNKLIKKYSLTPKQHFYIKILQQLVIWTDLRKLNHFQLHYWYAQELHALEKKCGVQYSALQYLFTNELEELQDNPKKLEALGLTRKKSRIIIESKSGVVSIVTPVKAKKMFFELSRTDSIQVIRGSVGSRGPKNRYRGIVRVLFSPRNGVGILLVNC
jgi:hypothetical protein